jgi:hypothetical protein
MFRPAWHLRVMKWLSSLHGWQRLWLVCSTIGLAYSVTIVPFNAVKDMRNWQYRAGMGYDYINPACQNYIAGSFDTLSQPPYSSGGTCWHIYTFRQFSEAHRIPTTYSAWEKQDEQRIWWEGLAVAAFMGAMALGCSALTYAVGAVAAWIFRGFRRTV